MKSTRFFISIILSFLVSNIFSQTIQERENDLRMIKIGEEWGQKKDKALELLEIDKFNYIAIDYILQTYQDSNHKDSIPLFFEKLIRDNSNNPEPYLLRVYLSRYESIKPEKLIFYLEKAREIDTSNITTNYELGKQYYQLFLKNYSEKKKKENLDYYASSSIRYFTYLLSIDERYLETMKYPLVQLTNYLGDSLRMKVFKNYNYQSSYFPISSFSGLPNDWETNYTIDVVWDIEFTNFIINWYSNHLAALEEPVLCDSLPAKIFRFTWLRSFDKPIVVGMSNMNDTVTLYWKVCDGAGGYEPGDIIEDKRKILTHKEWTTFSKKIDSGNFWNLPSKESEVYGTDGAQWILEGKELGKYHVVDRWSGGEIEKICLELIKLTDLKIDVGDIY